MFNEEDLLAEVEMYRMHAQPRAHLRQPVRNCLYIVIFFWVVLVFVNIENN